MHEPGDIRRTLRDSAMLTIRWLLICCLLTVCCGGGARADESTQATAGREKYPGQSRGNFLLIRDPLPLVKRMLESKGIRSAMRAMPEFPPVDEFEQALKEGGDHWVPEQITVAAGSDELTPFTAMVRAIALGELCQIAVGAGLSEQLDDVQAELISALKDVRAPELEVWVQFRNEEAALQLETLLRAVLSDLLQEDSFETEMTAEHVRVTTSVSSFAPASLLQGLLFQASLSDDLSDPDLVRIAELISPMNIQFLLRREGATLHLFIGDTDSQPSESTESPSDRRLWRDSGEDLLYANFRAAAFFEALTDSHELWKRLVGTELGKAIRETPTLLFNPVEIVSLKQMLGADTGDVEVRVSFPEGTGECLIEVLESTRATVATLHESEVMQFLPAEASAWFADSDHSPSDMIRDTIAQFELATTPAAPDPLEMSLVDILAQIQDEQQQVPFTDTGLPLERGGFARLLQMDTRFAFRPHILVAMTDGLTDSSVELMFESHGQNNSVRIESLGIPRFCFVMAITNTADLKKLADQVSSELLKLNPSTTPPVYLREARVDQIEPKVWFFTEELTGSLLPNGIRVRVSAECTPHFVVLEDRWLLLSNSLQMTRQVLAAKKDEALRKVVQGDWENHNMRSLIPQATIQKSLLAPAQWVDLLARNKLKITAQGLFAEGLVDGLMDNENVRAIIPEKFETLKHLALMTEEIHSHRITTDGFHRTTTVIRLVP